MIYCAWMAPMNSINAETPLTDCQILLYIMTERYPSAKKYRDVFERIKTAVLSLIAQGKHEPRNPVNLDSNVQAGFQSLTASVGPTMGADFSFMINTMTGNAMAANANAVSAVHAPAPAAAMSYTDLNMNPSANTAALGGFHPTQQHPQVDMGQFHQVWSGDPSSHNTGFGMDGMDHMYQ